jgi:ankyrin repeat protein
MALLTSHSNCDQESGGDTPLSSTATVSISSGIENGIRSCFISDENESSVFSSSTTSSSRSDSSPCNHDSTSSFDIKEMDDDGDRFPLHKAVADFALQAIADPDSIPLLEQRIRDLAQSCPESISTYNHNGMTPFHVACKEGASYQIIMDLFRICPSAVSTPTQPTRNDAKRRGRSTKRSMLPLHIACRYYSGLATIQSQIISFLIRVYPEAAQITTKAIQKTRTFHNDDRNEISDGDLPLHLYCENHFCNVNVLKLLIKIYPDAIKQRNRKGQLPIHLACERRYFQRVANEKVDVGKYKDKKINSNSTHARATESNTNTSSSSDDKIRFFAQAYPESLLVCDDDKGELPLHTAIRGYQNASTIEFLLSSCPQSIQFVDLKGRTALHRCVMSTLTDPQTMTLLLENDPLATCVLDHNNGGGNIPLLYATASKPLDLIYTMIRTCPISLEVLRNPTN